MAVVSRDTNIYTNADGLTWHFGAAEDTGTRSGAFSTMDSGGRHVVEVIIDLDALPTAASGDEQIQDDTIVIPAGAFIEEVQVLVVEEPTTSGSPNLDLGLVRTDRSTELDFNGFLAAADAWETGTDLGTKTTYVKGTTEVGALVGTVLANSGLITASADTADWTDGTVKVKIFYHIPLAADL